MNKQEFFNLIVSTAVNHYENPVVSNKTDHGADFCVVTVDGALRYMSLNQEVMDKIFEKFLSEEVSGGYDFRPFIIPNDPSMEVSFIEQLGEDFQFDKYTCGGLDTLEIVLDNRDNKKYLIINEGDEIVNTSDIKMEMFEDKCLFNSQGTSFELYF